VDNYNIELKNLHTPNVHSMANHHHFTQSPAVELKKLHQIKHIDGVMGQDLLWKKDLEPLHTVNGQRNIEHGIDIMK